MDVGERPTLSVVVTTDDQLHLGAVCDVLSEAVEVIAVTTAELAEQRAVTLRVFDLESSYRRNRGVAAATAPLIAFLEHGQVPAAHWEHAAGAAFARNAIRPSAAIGGRRDVVVESGGNIVYDAARLRRVGGFPLFTGAPPGSPVPDLLALGRLRAEGGRIVTVPEMTLGPGTAVSSLDARRLGRAARVDRQLQIAARTAASALRRRAPAAIGEVVAGALDDDWPFAPPDVARRMPQPIADAVGEHTPTPLSTPHKGKVHFLYRAGIRLLHLYIDPTDHLREALSARERIRQWAGEAVPRVLATAESVDALWLVEDFVAGEPLARRRLLEARDPVARWVVALGGPGGAELATVSGWRKHADELLSTGFDAEAAARLASSLEAVGSIRSRSLHGDLNPHNVLADGDRLVAVDWENAAVEFLPGVDLIFLLLLAKDARSPDVTVIADREPLLPYLQQLGIEEPLVTHALRVMLATWALGERKRRSRLGVRPAQPLFEQLFLEIEPLLA